MNTVTYDGRTYRLPFADLFRPLTDDERTGLRESIESHGILSQVLIYDSKAHGKDCVIDGGHRLTIGAEMGVVVPIRKVKDITDEQAASRAESLNLDRRQLPPSEAKRRRTERVQRIAKMRTDGMSLPAIADHEGISVAQVRRDLETAGSTLPGGKVEPESGKVTGKDGKERPAHPQVSSSQGDADESQASGPDDEPAAIDADTADVDLGGEAQGDDAEQAGGGGSEPADSQPGEAAPAGQPDPAAESLARVESLCRDMDQIAARMKGLKADRFCYSIHTDSAVAQVEAARKTLWQGRAAYPCPYCEASGEDGCKACGGTLRVKKTTLDSGRAAVGVGR